MNMEYVGNDNDFVARHTFQIGFDLFPLHPIWVWYQLIIESCTVHHTFDGTVFFNLLFFFSTEQSFDFCQML